MGARAFTAAFLIVASGFAGCAAAPVRDPAAEAKANEIGFFANLKAKRMPEAARFALYFSGREPSPRQSELLAQFYLETCQVRKAWEQIPRIADSRRRDEFTAAVLALVSVEREWSTAILEPTALAEPDPASPATRETLESEVWADEWAKLEIALPACEKFPALATEAERENARARAKKMFTALDAGGGIRRFDLLALALDVGFLPGRERARDYLARFSAAPANPYHVRLRTFLEDEGEAARKFRALAQSGGKIRLSELDLKVDETVTHAIPIPWLLEE